MTDKFNYEKRMIGHLIKYYYKNSNFTLEDFINGNDEHLKTMCNTCNKCSKPERICSKNTLYRLFDGSIVSNECIYYRLANKLNKQVILDRYDIYNKLKEYGNLLYENLVNLSATNLEKLELLITLDLEKYQNVLYVYEILSLYLNVIKDKLYPGYTPNKEEIEMYNFIKEFIDESNKKIILYYFYTGIFNRGNFGINYNETYNESEKYIDDPLFYERKLDCVYYVDQLSAYDFLNNEEISRHKSLNPYQKYCLYRKYQIVQINSEAFTDAYKSLLKCYEILETSDFGSRIKFATYLPTKIKP